MNCYCHVVDIWFFNSVVGVRRPDGYSEITRVNIRHCNRISPQVRAASVRDSSSRRRPLSDCVSFVRSTARAVNNQCHRGVNDKAC